MLATKRTGKAKDKRSWISVAQREGKTVYRCKLFITFSVSLFFPLFMTRIYITDPQSHMEGCWVQAEKTNALGSWGAFHCWCKSNAIHCITPGGDLPPGSGRQILFFFIIGAKTSLFRVNYLCFSQNFDDLKQYQPRIVQQMHLRMFIYWYCK